MAELLELLAERAEVEASRLTKLLETTSGSEREFFHKLIESGVASEEDCYRAWAEVLSLPFHRLNERDLDPTHLHRLPLQLAQRYGAVTVDETDEYVEVVLFQPLDTLAIDAITKFVRKEVRACVSTPSAIHRALDRQRKGKAGIEGLLARLDEEDLELMQDTHRLKRLTGDDAVVQLVNYLIEEALRLRASDLHLEPSRDQLRLRIRIDGDLETMHRFPMNLHAPMASRLKVLAKLDISEKRRPQDGRFMLESVSTPIELRVSVLPTIHGEKVVLRILDKEGMLLDLEHVGFLARNLELFRKGITAKNGLVLLTGPTGSGKTTTLYSAISEINEERINVVTLEDPVEYELEGTSQVQVDLKAGREFASTLRSILRQDPDVVMVGEIRDEETASIAIQAALTGHLVLSTLHTNDAPGAIYRLLDMGIDPYLLGPALRCVVAQRLVPRICPKCAAPHMPEPIVLASLGFVGEIPADGFKLGKGCRHCRNKGHLGRTAIHEVVHVDRTLQGAIARGITDDRFVEMAREKGYRPLIEDGLAKVSFGLITPEDLLGAVRAE